MADGVVWVGDETAFRASSFAFRAANASCAHFFMSTSIDSYCVRNECCKRAPYVGRSFGSLLRLELEMLANT